MIRSCLALIVPECGEVSDIVKTDARTKPGINEGISLSVEGWSLETITAPLRAWATDR